MADTTPTLREAAQQALEALENFTRDDVCESSHHSKADRHGPLSECPVAERFVATVEGLRAALAEQDAEQAEPVAPHPSYPHITQPYTLEEIRAQIASHDYSAELLLQHAMLLLDAAEQAEPVAVTAMIGKCQQCGHEHEIPPAAPAEPVEVTPEMLKAGAAEWLKYGEYEAQFPLAQGFDKLPRHLQVRLSRATHVYRAMRAAAPPAPARQEPLTEAQAKPLDEWDESNSDVLWWRFPIDEPPYVGHPNCDDWPGYHTHWTPLIVPAAPAEGGA